MCLTQQASGGGSSGWYGDEDLFPATSLTFDSGVAPSASLPSLDPSDVASTLESIELLDRPGPSAPSTSGLFASGQMKVSGPFPIPGPPQLWAPCGQDFIDKDSPLPVPKRRVRRPEGALWRGRTIRLLDDMEVYVNTHYREPWWKVLLRKVEKGRLPNAKCFNLWHIVTIKTWLQKGTRFNIIAIESHWSNFLNAFCFMRAEEIRQVYLRDVKWAKAHYEPEHEQNVSYVCEGDINNIYP